MSLRDIINLGEINEIIKVYTRVVIIQTTSPLVIGLIPLMPVELWERVYSTFRCFVGLNSCSRREAELGNIFRG